MLDVFPHSAQSWQMNRFTCRLCYLSTVSYRCSYQNCKMYLTKMLNVFVWNVKCISSFPSQLTNEQFTCRLCCPLPSPLCHTKGQQNTTWVFASATSSLLPMSFSALVAQLYNVSLEEHIGKDFLKLFSYISPSIDWQNCTIVSIWSDSGSHFEIIIMYQTSAKKIFAQKCYLWKSCIALQWWWWWWWRLQRFHDHHIIIFSLRVVVN